MPTTSANTTAAPIAMIFAFSDSFVLQALDGLTHEELWRPLTASNNPLLWVAGHIVQTRAVVLQMLAEQVETGWGPYSIVVRRSEIPRNTPRGLRLRIECAKSARDCILPSQPCRRNN